MLFWLNGEVKKPRLAELRLLVDQTRLHSADCWAFSNRTRVTGGALKECPHVADTACFKRGPTYFMISVQRKEKP